MSLQPKHSGPIFPLEAEYPPTINTLYTRALGEHSKISLLGTLTFSLASELKETKTDSPLERT